MQESFGIFKLIVNAFFSLSFHSFITKQKETTLISLPPAPSPFRGFYTKQTNTGPFANTCRTGTYITITTTTSTYNTILHHGLLRTQQRHMRVCSGSKVLLREAARSSVQYAELPLPFTFTMFDSLLLLLTFSPALPAYHV